MHFPEAIAKPSVTDSFVSVIDLSATCLELAGVERPDAIQGRSFLPILKDPEATVRDMVFAEQNWHVYSNHSRMIRFGDYLYIRNNYPGELSSDFALSRSRELESTSGDPPRPDQGGVCRGRDEIGPAPV